ncbi:MAG: DUF4351 domain-containing protein, partial [Methylococcaceae bacterium]|nr:DUF4351 domain-containing protein [Methylococcaceae bacterium]
LQEIDNMLAERVVEWTEKWKQQGLQQGMQQGIQQGMQRGVQQGEARVLRRQLTRRFGPLPDWAETRLSQATTDQCEEWADRLLDAGSLEGVLGPFE